MISSLPGKALITFVDIPGLPSDSTCDLKAEPGKIYIKRREPGILSSDYYVIFDFCVDSGSLATSFKECNFIMT